jgi:hypothetical protein
MDMNSLMDLAAAIEDETGALYRAFSTQFQSNPEGYRFWEEIAREEHRHADMIRVCKRQRHSIIMPRRLHTEAGMEFNRALSAIRQRRAGDTDGASIGQALETALEIERILHRLHSSTCRGIAEPMFVRLMSRLCDADAAHQHKIQLVCRSFSIDR